MALFLLSSCHHNDIEPETQTDAPLFTLSVTEGAGLRAIVPDEVHNKLLFTWDKGRPDLQLYFKQDGKIYKGPLLAPMKMKTKEGTLEEIENTAIFSFRPSTQIDASKPFTLYGVVAEQQMIQDNKLYVGVHPHPTHLLEKLSHNRLTIAPAYFKIESVEASKLNLEATMQHLGCTVLFYLKNSTGKKLSINGMALQGKDAKNSFYDHSSTDLFMEKVEAPFIDVDNQNAPIKHPITTYIPLIEIPSGSVGVMGFWARPKSEAGDMQEHQLVTKHTEPNSELKVISDLKLNRSGGTPQVGHAYHLYLDWQPEDKIVRLETRPQ